MAIKKASVLIALGLCTSFSINPAYADYTIGQSVEFRDDFHSYGGGWIPATITEDRGPGAVDRYVIKLETGDNKDARVGGLRPTDGSPRMKPKNAAENNYRNADADARADAEQAAKTGTAAAQTAPPTVAAQPTQQNWATPPARAPFRAAQPRAGAPARQAPRTPAGGMAFGKPPANTSAAVLGNGLFPNGKPLGIPGQTNYGINNNGQKSIVTVAPPGEESFIGRWNLKAGGTWTTVYGSEKEVDGRKERLLEYGFPVDADVLVINPDKTWYKQFAGKRTTGTWFDLGQNVVQLVAFDNDDWTGSVIKGQMEVRSPSGMWEYGKRF